MRLDTRNLIQSSSELAASGALSDALHVIETALDARLDDLRTSPLTIEEEQQLGRLMRHAGAIAWQGEDLEGAEGFFLLALVCLNDLRTLHSISEVLRQRGRAVPARRILDICRNRAVRESDKEMLEILGD